MLGAQITGRLLPEQNENPMIYDLIKKCDQMAGKINSLVPVFHCLHTPGKGTNGVILMTFINTNIRWVS